MDDGHLYGLSDDPNDAFRQFQEKMNKQLQEVEAEIDSINVNSSLKEKKSNEASILFQQLDKISEYLHQDQEKEAIYSLVRAVQKLLDEKAAKKILSEKANIEYVDKLYERVTSGIKDNLGEYEQECLNDLEYKVTELKSKMDQLRSFMQTELRKIQVQIDELHQDNGNAEDITPKPQQLTANSTQRKLI